MRKFLKWMTWISVSLLIVISCLIVFIGYTQTGLDLSLKIMQKYLPGKLELAHARGKLFSRISLQELNYYDSNLHMHIKQVKLAWSPYALIFGKLKISALSANQVNIQYIEPIKPATETLIDLDFLEQTKQKKLTQKSTSFNNPLPFNLNIKNLNLQQIHYRQNQLQIDLESLQGKIKFNKKVATKVQLNSLRIKQSKQTQFTLKQAELNLHGKAKSYQINAKANYSIEKWPQQVLQFSGKGKQNSINLNNIQVKTLTGRLNGHAKLNWHNGITWQALFIAKRFRLPIDVNNQINFDLNTQGKYKSTKLQTLKLQVKQLSGSYNNQSVHGDLTLEYKKNNLTVRQILNIGANQFKLLIKKNKLWQARWHIDAPNLNQLSPEFKGQLHTIGNFNGTVNNPHIVTKVTIQNFAYQHWRAHTIKANVNITDLAKANNQAHILVNQLANDTFSPIDIQANLHGNFSQQQLKMALKNSNATVKLMLQGKYANQTWFGHMSQLNIDPTKKQHWQLKQPVSLKLNGKQFQFSTLCLYHGVSSICAQLNWQRQQKLALNLQVKNFHLKSIQHLLPINSKLNGNINLTGRILQTQQQLKTFNFKLNAYNINYQYQLDDEYHKLYIANLLTNTQLKKNNLTTTLHARLFGAETIYGKIALPNFKKLKISAKQKIIGHIDVSVKNVNDLLRVFPHVTQASGVIHGKINLQGTLSRPKLKGKIHWDRGGLRFANWGLKLTGIQAALTGDEKGLIELTAHGNSGRGHFKLNGNYDLLRSIDHGKIHLSGKNLTLFDTNDYNVIASPDLTLTLHDRNIKFNGKIEVPSAEIKPTNFTSEVNYASDDIVYVKEDTQTPRFYQVSGVVAIKLGKYINLNTAGLTGKLAGKLKLFYNNQSITTANGELKIKQGQYKAYGQTLKITTGELNFNGSPIDNPNLNITAVKRIRTIQRSDISLGNFSMPSNYAVSGYMTVGVQISGTLNKYKVKLISSQSSLSQSDILSMLVLGKPVSDLNQGNAQSLLSAASALKLGSQVTGGITQRIQQALGLDEFGIEDDAVLASNQENKKPGESINTSAVVIGKKITNNLFISYSLGLIDPVSIFRARYQLNNRLSLRTEASVLGTGVDMFYTFEAGNRYRKYHEQH